MRREWSKYQLAIFDAYENTKQNIFVNATAGCLGKDTPILMYDGSIKKVQDIQVGDLVMGPDSTPRTVLETHTGISDLYEVNPTKGDSWICNDTHIFTVWDEYINQRIKRYKNTKHKTALVDYPLSKILTRPLTSRGDVSYMFLQRTGIKFKETSLPIDPYFLGLWLADGTKSRDKVQITVNSDDSELFEYLEKFTFGKNKLIYSKKKRDETNCHYVEYSTKEWGLGSNELLTFLRTFLNEDKSLNIPLKYYVNSRENQLQLLAGLLDSDGCINWKKYKGENIAGCFSITTKYTELRDVILYICRSIGLAAYASKTIGKIKSLNFEGEYWNITISGELSIIPTKLKRKATKRTKPKSVLRTGFSIKKLDKGIWYGFKVDKDERFLLGDFTITHNSSKTTCMVECAKRTPMEYRCLFMAFNKSIAEELSQRLPDWFETATFHSKGFKVFLYNFKIRPKINENKTFKIGGKILKFEDIDFKEQTKYLFDLQTIWNQIRVNLYKREEWKEKVPDICIEKDIEFKDRIIEDLEHIEDKWMKNAKSLSNNQDFELDFTDMLYLPYKMIDPIKFPKYDIVNLDEGQDLNVLQREMALRYLKPRGRFTIFGDFSQAIYSFQGASINNFRYFQSLPNTVILPLSITYRCAKRIVEEAKKVFPDNIEASPTAEEGIVRWGDLSEVQENDYVICRNNLPLVESFLKFIEFKKKATIKGKDFGESLSRLLEKVNDISDLDDLLEAKIQNIMDKDNKISRNMAKNNASYIALEEKVQIIKILYNRFLGSFENLKTEITTIFSDDCEGITLCTCHKSKGLESDRVFFLNPELIPSEHAKTPDALYAEKCLKFVAITRAKKELIYCRI